MMCGRQNGPMPIRMGSIRSVRVKGHGLPIVNVVVIPAGPAGWAHQVDVALAALILEAGLLECDEQAAVQCAACCGVQLMQYLSMLLGGSVTVWVCDRREADARAKVGVRVDDGDRARDRQRVLQLDAVRDWLPHYGRVGIDADLLFLPRWISRRQMHRRHVQLADAADQLVADPALHVNVAGGAQRRPEGWGHV